MFQLLKRRPFQKRVEALGPRVVENSVGLDRADHPSSPGQELMPGAALERRDFELNLQSDLLKQVLDVHPDAYRRLVWSRAKRPK
jgi:hypothetical protein